MTEVLTKATESAVGSWRTTIYAVMTAACGFIMVHPEHFTEWPIVGDIADYLVFVGIVGMGVSSRDHKSRK